MLTVAASEESEDDDSVEYYEPDEGNIEVDPVFQEDYEFPGTVKITVNQTHFWSVRSVIWMAILNIWRLIITTRFPFRL